MSITNDPSSEDEDFAKITEANFQKIRNRLTKVGYADGVSDGREETFQSAFDVGYADGLRTGFEIEKYNAFYNNFNNLNGKSEELNSEKSHHSEMTLAVSTDASHYRFPEYRGEALTTISNQQNKYVDKFLKQCQQRLPLTSSLLASKRVAE